MMRMRMLLRMAATDRAKALERAMRTARERKTFCLLDGGTVVVVVGVEVVVAGLYRLLAIPVAVVAAAAALAGLGEPKISVRQTEAGGRGRGCRMMTTTTTTTTEEAEKGKKQEMVTLLYRYV